MTRSEDSALLALTELQQMEQERSEREIQERLAEQERAQQQEHRRQQQAREAEQRRAAEQTALRVEAEHRRANQEAEDRRRLEEAEARARAEHDARLANVQRELSAELHRREMRRTARLAATGIGTAMLASVAGLVVWMGISRPTESPRLAEFSTVDVDALTNGLERLHEDNESLRDDIKKMRAQAEEIAQAEPEDIPVEATPAPEVAPPKARPRRPGRSRPRSRPKANSTPKKTPPPTTRRATPLVLDDDSGDPLAGIKKKSKDKK